MVYNDTEIPLSPILDKNPIKKCLHQSKESDNFHNNRFKKLGLSQISVSYRTLSDLIK